jgi:hypothetical protein
MSGSQLRYPDESSVIARNLNVDRVNHPLEVPRGRTFVVDVMGVPGVGVDSAGQRNQETQTCDLGNHVVESKIL